MPGSLETYLHCGLRVRSALDLHLPRVFGDPDVTVVWGDEIDDTDSLPPGEVIAEIMQGPRRMLTATQHGDGYLVRFPDCGEFAISADLARVEARPQRNGSHSSLLPVLMAGAVASIVHELRGSTVIHASAVAVGGRALVFVGHSGQGKSTLAAWMCREGSALVTDDVLVVDSADGPACVGAAAELRLRPAANSLAGPAEGFGTRATPDQRVALSPPAVCSERLPLGAIVIPRPVRDCTDLELAEVPPVGRLVALLAFPRIDGWSHEGVLARRFDVLAALADSVPVFVARVPWGPPFRSAVARDLGNLVTR